MLSEAKDSPFCAANVTENWNASLQWEDLSILMQIMLLKLQFSGKIQCLLSDLSNERHKLKLKFLSGGLKSGADMTAASSCFKACSEERVVSLQTFII